MSTTLQLNWHQCEMISEVLSSTKPSTRLSKFLHHQGNKTIIIFQNAMNLIKFSLKFYKMQEKAYEKHKYIVGFSQSLHFQVITLNSSENQ